MSEPLTPAETDYLMDKFDATDTRMQRQIVAAMVSELADAREQVRVLREACESARRLIPFGVVYQELTDALRQTEAQP